MGIFKYIFWLAPVLMAVMYYITAKQEKFEAKMDKEAALFDRDFAKSRMGGNDKEYWTNQVDANSKKIAIAEEEEKIAKEKSDRLTKELETKLSEGK